MDCLELVFLVARFLHRSLGLPLDSVEALLAQAQMMQTSSSSRSLREGEEGNPLLPQRLDWRGIPHPLSYLQLLHHYEESSKYSNFNGLEALISHLISLSPQKSLLTLLPPSTVSPSALPLHRTPSSLLLWNNINPALRNHRLHLKSSPASLLLPHTPSSSSSSLLMYSNAFRNRRSRQNNSNLKPTINNRIITSPYTQYKKLISMRGHIAPIYTAMFDRKDERLVTGSDDNLIKVWDVKTGWLLRTLRGHQAAPRGKDSVILDLAISHDNRLLASASTDKTIRVWDFNPDSAYCYSSIAVFNTRHEAYIIFFSPSAPLLAASFDDGNGKVWTYDPDTLEFNNHNNSNNHLLSNNHNQQHNQHHNNNNANNIIPLDFRPVPSIGGFSTKCMDISKSGSRLALGRNDGFVYVYSLVAEEFEELREEDDDEENVVVLVDDLDVAGGDLGIRRTRSSSNINNQNHNANNGNNPKSKRNRLPSSSSSSPTSSSNQTHPNPCRHHNHALTEPPRLIINLRHEAEIVETAFNEAGDRLVAVSRDGLAKIWRFDVTTTTTNGGGGVLGWVALDRKVLIDLKKAAEEYSANNHSGANVKFQELFTEGHHIDDDEEEGNVVGGGYNVDDDNSPPPLPPLLPLVNDHPVSSAGSSSRPALLIPPLPQARPTPLQDVFQPPQPLPAYHQDPAVMIAGGGAIVEDDDSFSVVRLAWTCDDRFVLTSSDSCIRVWDPETGDLVATLQGFSKNYCSVYPHPFNPNVVLTVSDDGNVVIWDLSRRVVLTAFRVALVQGQHPPHFLCYGSFSNSGKHIILSDTYGTVTLLGLGISHLNYSSTPLHQFFKSDYDPVRLDINGAPVDELTQRPANVEHPGAVCDRDYVAYEVWREYERGKVWRKWYKKSIDERKQKKQKQVDDEVNRVVYAEDGDGEAAFRRWILDRDRVAVQERGLLLMELVHSNPTRDIKELSRRKKALQEGKNMANGDSFVGQAGRGGADHASGGDRRGGRGAAAALENETPPLDDAIFDPNQLPFMIFDDINDDDYNGEGGGGGRDGLDDEDDEEGEGEDMDGSSAVHFLPRSTRSRGGPVPLEDLNAVFRMGGSSSRRSRIIYDDDDEEEEEEARETGDEDETDEWDDDSSSAGGGGGGRRDESRRKRRLISSTSSAASVSSAQVRTTPRPVKTSRVSYKEDDASDIDLMDLEGDDDDLSASLTRRVNNNKSSSTKSKNKMLLLPLAPTLPWKVSEWVCSTSPDPVSYHPQLGDAVAYLRKGHERFLEKNADVCECKQLLDSDIVFAYVKEIHWTPYAVQHPPDFRQALPKCRLGLEIIPTRSLLPQLHEIRPSRKGKRKLEYVQFWEDDGLAPFIVLLEVYEAGMSQSLHVGDEVNVLYDSEVHSATIAAIAGPDDNLPGYPWECAKVDWGFTFGDAAPCDVNLWEVRKVADASSSRTRASSLTRRSVSPTRTSATSSSRKSLSTFTSSDFLWTEKLDANEMAQTLETVENLISMDELSVFVEQVDYTEYPVYLEDVAYPIYLGLVRDRLKNSFYRRLEAVKFDLELIRLNAMTFNTEGSFIHTFAEQHMKDLLNFNPHLFEAVEEPPVVANKNSTSSNSKVTRLRLKIGSKHAAFESEEENRATVNGRRHRQGSPVKPSASSPPRNTSSSNRVILRKRAASSSSAIREDDDEEVGGRDNVLVKRNAARKPVRYKDGDSTEDEDVDIAPSTRARTSSLVLGKRQPPAWNYKDEDEMAVDTHKPSASSSSMVTMKPENIGGSEATMRTSRSTRSGAGSKSVQARAWSGSVEDEENESGNNSTSVTAVSRSKRQAASKKNNYNSDPDIQDDETSTSSSSPVVHQRKRKSGTSSSKKPANKRSKTSRRVKISSGSSETDVTSDDDDDDFSD